MSKYFINREQIGDKYCLKKTKFVYLVHRKQVQYEHGVNLNKRI